ncbi:hypothetical protein CHCC14817_0119 [Bacillus paralicheniformis]|nr:hypothetical protein SC10_B2orf01532 [Bacillus paralicheniformis]TWL99792.1 hypothetical protein CHCC15136_2168 [Bacillus paralicheniformis]TWM51718.1 hypothetical protein CHCC14817_0119 [Bacillus paralicheniformis]TWN64579.1 hypothetical protein CHCC12620_0278 [Bacillus paralicheniformis]
MNPQHGTACAAGLCNGYDPLFERSPRFQVRDFIAVKRQLMHGLSADGICGPKTKAKIEALLK